MVGFRVALAVAAGIGRYSVGKTFFYTLISYLLFAGLLAYLGFKLVTHFDVIEHYFRTYNAIVWQILISAVVVFVARRFLQTRSGWGTK